VPFEPVAARLYAQVEFDLANAGTPIDHNDLQIAATALARGWGVATLNVGDFGRVQGLVVLGPGNEPQP
jgi:predicted nucleic acid-binding protein